MFRVLPLYNILLPDNYFWDFKRSNFLKKPTLEWHDVDWLRCAHYILREKSEIDEFEGLNSCLRTNSYYSRDGVSNKFIIKVFLKATIIKHKRGAPYGYKQVYCWEWKSKAKETDRGWKNIFYVLICKDDHKLFTLKGKISKHVRRQVESCALQSKRQRSMRMNTCNPQERNVLESWCYDCWTKTKELLTSSVKVHINRYGG